MARLKYVLVTAVTPFEHLKVPAFLWMRDSLASISTTKFGSDQDHLNSVKLHDEMVSELRQVALVDIMNEFRIQNSNPETAFFAPLFLSALIAFVIGADGVETDLTIATQAASKSKREFAHRQKILGENALEALSEGKLAFLNWLNTKENDFLGRMCGETASALGELGAGSVDILQP